MSGLTDALKGLVSAFKSVNSGRYTVRRGALNWAAFPFETHPYAVSIQVDETALFSPTGIYPSKISIEVATAMPDEAPTDSQIDDDAMDTLVTDSRSALISWIGARNASGDPLVLKVERLSANVVEFHDASLNVQGIVISLNIDT